MAFRGALCELLIEVSMRGERSEEMKYMTLQAYGGGVRRRFTLRKTEWVM